MEGTLIAGRYRVVRELGSGAMGAVYEAIHETLDQRVAVKVLRTELTVASLVPRFFREAKTASSLGHPSIVRVYDAGTTEDGLPFLVMDLLEGQNLDDYLYEHGPQPLPEVIRLLSGPCSGLDLAHARGILHRDLKLENLFVHRRDDGVEEVRIVDFGLATFTHDREATRRLTAPGTYLGTPEYMAPEMVEELALDHRADVYALGVMAYELLTGRVPIDGETPMAILTTKVTEDAPPLDPTGEAFSAATEVAIARALDRDRTRRPITCGAFLTELAVAAGFAERPSSISTRAVRPSSAPPAPGTAESSASILLVEDDPHFGALIQRELTAVGYRVELASSLDDADAMLGTLEIDGLIVDGLLPDGSGLELVARARAGGLEIPIVFVSGFWSDDRVSNLLHDDLDVELVIHKPLDPAHLAEQLVDLLPPRRQAPASPVAAGLEALRDDYVGRLAEQLEELHGHLTDFASGRAESDAPLVRSAHIAHQIRGTAGSFGFDELSERMSHVQTSLDPYRAGDSPLLSLRFLRGLVEVVEWARSDVAGYMRSSARHEARLAFVARFLFDAAGDPSKALVALARTVGVELVQDVTEEGVRFDGGLLVASDDERRDLARIAALRTTAHAPDLPIAVVGRQGSTEDHLSALRYGASMVLDPSPTQADLLEMALRFRALRRGELTRVLAIDDDPDLVTQIAAWLYPRGVRVIPLHQPRRVLEALEDHDPDLVLLDLVMPDLSGIDVCRVIRSSPRFASLPVVFLTGTFDRRSRMGCYWAGADDVIQKPVLPEELHSRVELRLRHARMRRQREELDPLTGLRTRQAFVREVEATLLSAAEHQMPVTLALIGLDEMRGINDRFGSAGGDLVLRALGGLLGSRARAEDLAGRWGGDEVALALPGLTPETAAPWIRELRQHFSDTCIQTADEREIPARFRVGIVSAPPDGGQLDELMGAAAREMERAKKQSGVAVTNR